MIVLALFLVTVDYYTQNKNTPKTLLKVPGWRKKNIITGLWVVYGYYFFLLPIQDLYPTHFAGHPYTARITATITQCPTI